MNPLPFEGKFPFLQRHTSTSLTCFAFLCCYYFVFVFVVYIQAEAIYGYCATEPGELTLELGDTVKVLKYEENGWWRGQLTMPGKPPKTGLFPATYVKKINRPGNFSPFPFCLVLSISSSFLLSCLIEVCLLFVLFVCIASSNKCVATNSCWASDHPS